MIYLDNAATSFPKPPAVAAEVARCITDYGGNAGRGAHSLALAAANKIFECRAELAELFGASDADRVFFTQNTTYGINTVIKGLLKNGDHVIISDMEHNAVYRPIVKLAAEGKITYDVFKTFTADPRHSHARVCASFESLIRPNTRMVFCVHSSNICSATLPIAEIGKVCRRHGVLLCVDGAQSAGHIPIDITRLGIDALCVPGHKGLYGPQGSGAVILGKNIALDTLVEGGNGVDSLEPQMTLSSPERYEAGTLSLPAIAGLCEGVKELKKRGIDASAERCSELCRTLCERLACMGGVELYVPQYRGSVALFNVRGVPCETVAAALDERGICVRAGLHCAPLAHKTLGTDKTGAVRVSFGIYNTFSDIDALCRALNDIIKEYTL